MLRVDVDTVLKMKELIKGLLRREIKDVYFNSKSQPKQKTRTALIGQLSQNLVLTLRITTLSTQFNFIEKQNA